MAATHISPRLTDEVMTSAVAKDLGAHPVDVRVDRVEVTGGAAEGENYQCVLKMVRVTATVRGERKERNYVAKYMGMNPEQVARQREVRIRRGCQCRGGFE